MFCTHEYTFFNQYEETRFLGNCGCQYVYEFVCPKCKKTFTITQDELTDELERASRYINKKKALGKDIPYTSQWISLHHCGHGLYGYEGEYVSMVIEKYKKKGIDLWEILENPRKRYDQNFKELKE
jgi:hypothetical protein